MFSNTLLLNTKLHNKLHKLTYLAKKTIYLIIVCGQVSICSDLAIAQPIHNDAENISFFQQLNTAVRTRIDTVVDTVKNLFTTKNYAIIEYPNTRYGGRMEDRHIIIDEKDEKTAIYAVFDGHGGQSVAQYIVDKSIDGVTPRIVSNINYWKKRYTEPHAFTDSDALIASLAFLELNLWENCNDINAYGYESPYNYGEKEKYGDSGATAIIAKKTDNILTLANVGDSRAILIRNGKIIQTTIDHKPSNSAEKERVLKAGGRIFNGYAGLGNVGFALTRSMGDINAKKSMHDQQIASGQAETDYNPILTAEPDIYTWSLEKNDILLLASDGLWDVMDSQFNTNDNGNLQKYLNKTNVKNNSINLNKLVANLKKYALEKGSRDNITVLAVRF